MSTANLSPELVSKLQILQQKLGADDLEAALNKSLNIANFVADTVHDQSSKLLVERDGKFTELKEIA